MYQYVQYLLALKTDYEKAWSDVSKAWESPKDNLRYLSYIVQEKEIPKFSWAGRQYVGEDAYGVKTFHFGELEPKEVNRGSYLASYFYGASSSTGNSPKH